MIIKLLIFFLAFWMAPSVLIDFVAAPAIFRNVSNIEEAGTLGMVIFKAFNSLELVLSLVIFGLAFHLSRKNILKKPWLILFSVLVMWAGFFRFYLSPSIIEINKERYQLSEESEKFEILSKEHRFYHKLYVKMEGAKVIFLLVGVIMVFRIREEQEI